MRLYGETYNIPRRHNLRINSMTPGSYSPSSSLGVILEMDSSGLGSPTPPFSGLWCSLIFSICCKENIL